MSIRVNRDKNLHHLRVTDATKIPIYRNLGQVGDEPGMEGDIVLNLNEGVFPDPGIQLCFHNGVTWDCVGGISGDCTCTMQETYDNSALAGDPQEILVTPAGGTVTIRQDALGAVEIPFAITDANGNAIFYVEANGGTNHILIGAGATVAGNEALSIGATANAGANDAIAIGPGANATALDALALGAGVQSTGLQSIAIGGDDSGATTASNNFTIAMGANAVASTIDGIAIGRDTQATAGANPGGIAVGAGAVSNNDRCIAIGHEDNFNTLASGSDNIAIGTDARATGPEFSLAIGTGVVTTSVGGTAIGNSGTTVTGASGVAIGTTAQSLHDGAVVLGGGVSTRANSLYATIQQETQQNAVYYNTGTGEFTYDLPTGGGGGSPSDSPWEVVGVDFVQNVGLPGVNFGDNNLLFGSSDTTSAGSQDTRMFFIANNAEVGTGLGSFRAGRASGPQWDTRGDFSVAFGDDNIVTGDNAGALSGTNHTVEGDNCAVVSGTQNNIDTTASLSTIVAGASNSINASCVGSMIGAGNDNALTATTDCIIGAGQNNDINSCSRSGIFVGGGAGLATNTLELSTESAIIAGIGNALASSNHSLIGVGEGHKLINTSPNSAIVAGGGTIVPPGGPPVAGGNNIDNSEQSFIGAGQINQINGSVNSAIVAGGGVDLEPSIPVVGENVINNSTQSIIGAGIRNKINEGTNSGVYAGSRNVIGQESPIIAVSDSMIGAGRNHIILAETAFIGAGGSSGDSGSGGNEIRSAGRASFIGAGGDENQQIIDARAAFIVSGDGNEVLNNGVIDGALQSGICGGQSNEIVAGSGQRANNSIIGAGVNNVIGEITGSLLSGSASNSGIVAGQSNLIQADKAFIGAGGFGSRGNGNLIGGGSDGSFIGAGGVSLARNEIEQSPSSGIVAGEGNRIFLSDSSVIAGGQGNRIDGSALSPLDHVHGFIGCGRNNELQATGSSILGGQGNIIYAQDLILGGDVVNSAITAGDSQHLDQANTTMTQNLRVGDVQNSSPPFADPVGGAQFQSVRVIDSAREGGSPPVLLTHEDHTVLGDTSTTGIEVELPSPAVIGQRYYIKRITDDGNTLRISDPLGPGIRRATLTPTGTLDLVGAGDNDLYSVIIIFTGGAWDVVAEGRIP